MSIDGVVKTQADVDSYKNELKNLKRESRRKTSNPFLWMALFIVLFFVSAYTITLGSYFIGGAVWDLWFRILYIGGAIGQIIYHSIIVLFQVAMWVIIRLLTKKRRMLRAEAYFEEHSNRLLATIKAIEK